MQGDRVDPKIVAIVDRMRDGAHDRDLAMSKVRMVRDGKFAELWPDQFSERYPTSIVANFVDISARDLASSLAGLPTLACAAGAMRTDADKRRAEKKNRIGYNFWLHSMLEYQMKSGADQYVSYGFLPLWVEADYDAKMPFINVVDPEGCYFELDRRLKTKQFARCWREDIQELAVQWPEYRGTILTDPTTGKPATIDKIEVVLYIDDTYCTLYLPDRNGVILDRYAHRMRRAGKPACPVHVAIRPGLHNKPRGQYDDVLYVQLAHAVMAALTLEAGHKAVQAPLTVPNDVQEINIGPDAIMQTDNPGGVQRVPLNVPAAAFQLGEQLKEEMHEGAGYPDTRLGNGPAGGTTGRGVDALEGGYDAQIDLGQDVLKLAFIEATSMAFELDVILWPNVSKTINGILSGESFEVTYTPLKDIGDNVSCNVTYGFAAGNSPSAKIVTLLQLRGDNLIGRDFTRRNLGFDIDTEQQQREIDVEIIEDGLKQGLAAALQSAGQMMAQGMTAEAMQFFQAASMIIDGRRKGEELAPLFSKAFQPPPAPPQAPAPAGGPPVPGGPGGAPGAPGAGGGPPGADTGLAGVGPTGLPPGVAPGQAGMPPGGRPSVADLAAGFTGNGTANLTDSIRRRLPVG